jgi:VWFA-related protein
MTRVLVALGIVTAAAAAAGSHQDPADRAPTGRLLRIDAVALDRTGAPVQELRKEELEVRIGGFRIPIEALVAVTPSDAERGRRSMVLLLDDLTLEPSVVFRAKEVARRFVTRMSPGDEMAIVPLNRGVMKSTADPTPLLRSIDAYNVGPAGVMRPDTIAEQVLTTVAGISRQLAEAPARRRTIVGIGAAWLFDTPIPPSSGGRDLRSEWEDALRAMAVSNVTLYAIDPGGIGAVRSGSGSSGFARDTGGHAFVNTNDLTGAVDRIMRETAMYYTIEVQDPPVFRKSELRELDVRVLRRGITVRARRAISGAR